MWLGIEEAWVGFKPPESMDHTLSPGAPFSTELGLHNTEEGPVKPGLSQDLKGAQSLAQLPKPS